MMHQSQIAPQYYIQPPDLPEFIYATNQTAWVRLIVWSYNEYKRRLTELPKSGAYKELRRQADEYSPVRILAEMKGFRRLCARMSADLWNSFDARTRRYIRKAFDLRELLFKDSE